MWALSSMMSSAYGQPYHLATIPCVHYCSPSRQWDQSWIQVWASCSSRHILRFRVSSQIKLHVLSERYPKQYVAEGNQDTGVICPGLFSTGPFRVFRLVQSFRASDGPVYLWFCSACCTVTQYCVGDPVLVESHCWLSMREIGTGPTFTGIVLSTSQLSAGRSR